MNLAFKIKKHSNNKSKATITKAKARVSTLSIFISFLYS